MTLPALRCKILLVTLFALLAACGSGGYAPPVTETGSRGELVSATASFSYTSNALQGYANTNGLAALSADMRSGVNTYKLIYWTVDTAGTPIKVSGLLAIPSTSDASTTRLVAYHHGTIFHTEDAPTNSDWLHGLSAMLASTDFIVTLPDYIGYGESVAALHPYMHADSLAKTSIDMLRAAKSFMASNGIAFHNQLLLGGYSEGGYAAVATHKTIQEHYTDEFTIVATAAGAGAYDMRTTANALLNSPELAYAAYVAFVFKAYDDIYNFNRISEIFNTDYVDTINNDFYGSVYGSVIEAKLSKDTATLFKPDFLGDFRDGIEEAINSRLSENNIYDWTPLAPVRLYHGQLDTTVPYANSVTALNAMTSSGEAVVNISNCIPQTDPANHNNCYIPYLVNMTQFFLAR